MEFTKKLAFAVAIAVTPFLSAAMQNQMSGAAQDTPALQGDVLKKNQYPAAYNAQACYQIKDRGQDWFAQASFLYWYIGQEGLELAISGAVITSTPNSFTYSPRTHILHQKFEYTPGFKVGLGFNFNQQDNWVGYFEYTRIRSSTRTSKEPINNKRVAAANLNAWIPLWYNNTTPGGTPGTFDISTELPIPAAHIESKWHVGLNYYDGTIGRPYYLSRKVVINPSFGVRLAFIEQSLRIRIKPFVGLMGVSPLVNHLRSNNKSESWALGPRACLGGHWLLGGGWRLDGSAGASLLYTRFSEVRHKEDAPDSTGITPTTVISDHKYHTMRPWVEGGLGLAWGSYIYNAAYHIDLSASYDFNYLWGQNMMRKLVQMANVGTGNTTGSGAAAGDLFMHGLTLTGRFDF